jgi:hypothetical protein
MSEVDGRAYDLEDQLKLALEAEIIEVVAQKKRLEIRMAMDIFYRSKLSEQINSGEYGIQYLSAHYLAEDLLENESELFQ